VFGKLYKYPSVSMWGFVLTRKASHYIVSIHNVACSVRSNLVAIFNLIISVIVLKWADLSVFAFYPHPGGQGLAEP